MSLQTLSFLPAKDFSVNKTEISTLLQEIDNLESKKQMLLKSLSYFSSSLIEPSLKTPFSDTSSVKSSNTANPLKSSERNLNTITKETNKTKEELYSNKIDGANKPSHLYMALAKYLFYDQQNNEGSNSKEEEDSKRNESFDFEQKEVVYEPKKIDYKPKNVKNVLNVVSFDNVSLESVSTKDNYSLKTFNSHYKNNFMFLNEKSEQNKSSFDELICKEQQELDLIWSKKNQKLLSKYSDELNNDWTQIAQKFTNKKVTQKIVKDQLNNKNFKNMKRTRFRFTLYEDQRIINLIQRMGQNWRDIAKSLPGRTEGMVKNRFYSHIKRKYFASTQSGKEKSNNIEVEKFLDVEPLFKNNSLRKKFNLNLNSNLDINFDSMVNEMINEPNFNEQEEKICKIEEDQEFFALFDDKVDQNEGNNIEENFEFNLLKTPETFYNFDDYHNNLIKLTPFEKNESNENLMKDEKNESLNYDFEVRNSSKSNKKRKIRVLSEKIEDIEQLLQTTKSQITKFYRGADVEEQ